MVSLTCTYIIKLKMYNFYFIVAIVVLLFELYGFTNTNFPAIHFHYRLSTSVGVRSKNINLENQYSILRHLKEYLSVPQPVTDSCPLSDYWLFSLEEYQDDMFTSNDAIIITHPSVMLIAILLETRVEVYRVKSESVFDDTYYEFNSPVQFEKLMSQQFHGKLLHRHYHRNSLSLFIDEGDKQKFILLTFSLSNLRYH